MRKRTKALAIPPKVKAAVWRRDDGVCIFCHRPGNPDAHYIGRGQGGLGIEENVFTACWDCHRKYDQSVNRDRMKAPIKKHLQSHYPNWDESKLIYRKGIT